MKTLFNKFIVLVLCLSLCSLAFGQDQAAGNSEDSFADDTKNDLMIVAGLGGVGAVLGLSTLSFESEPSDHYDRILTGAAVGIIAGVIVVAYNQATRHQAGFQQATYKPNVDFSTLDRVVWHSETYRKREIDGAQTLFQFNF